MKSMLYATNYKGKDKFPIGVFLCDIYSKELVMDSDIQIIIWSDGIPSEFNNQFMWQLIEDLSRPYKKKIIWKFSATSHGKGIIDGISGTVTSNVRHQVMSMKKDRPIIQDSESSTELVQMLKSSNKSNASRMRK